VFRAPTSLRLTQATTGQGVVPPAQLSRVQARFPHREALDGGRRNPLVSKC
jgi:hypothetical protein